jgi:tetratricopeptide (TPR) repeat protein
VKGYASQLADEGRQLLQQSKLIEAKAKLQLADQTLAGQKPVSDALAEIKRREDDYQRLKAGAQADVTARNYSSARDKYQQAQSAHPEQYAADNLAARLNEVNGLLARGVRGGNTGNIAATTSTGNTAAPAGGNAGGTGTAARGGGVDPKAAETERLAKAAKDYLSQGKYAEADRDYAALLKLDPKNREAADAIGKSRKFTELKDRSAQLARSKNNADAQQALVEARGIDPDRFNREGLAAILDNLAPKQAGPDPARAALQQGLVALLNGRAQESIGILEPALARAANSASLHAYLGVAYATQALSTPKAEDRSRLQDKAMEQFKLAKSAQSDYQLSPRIVSPSIVSLYQNARP